MAPSSTEAGKEVEFSAEVQPVPVITSISPNFGSIAGAESVLLAFDFPFIDTSVNTAPATTSGTPRKLSGSASKRNARRGISASLNGS